MDPLTQALILANTIAGIVSRTLDAMPPDAKAEYARLQVEQLHRWRDFCDKLHDMVHHD